MAHRVLTGEPVADRPRNDDGDRVDFLVYVLWAAVLLVLVRYL